MEFNSLKRKRAKTTVSLPRWDTMPRQMSNYLDSWKYIRVDVNGESGKLFRTRDGVVIHFPRMDMCEAKKLLE